MAHATNVFMKQFLSLLLFMCATSWVFAQTDGPKGNGKLSGTVLDSANQNPVEFATVALLEANSEKAINGAVADEKGNFVIKGIAPGKYKVVVSFIGYETKTLPIAVDDKESDLGNIKISTQTELLKEVVIEGQKAIIEERVDRTIYNAENDLTAKGGDATDVLKRVPMLSVDIEGNVSLRGNSNIQVLINNKPSTIVASSIADALKQIPADQIKTVEVITSPSAKYDAEGSAGIINIITKKNNIEGLTLNINSGIGLRGSNLGLNGNYRKGKMGFSLGGWGRSNYNINGSFKNTQLTTDRRTIQEGDTRNNGLFGNYNLGWDYDINPKNFMTASVRFGLRNGRRYQDNLTRQTFVNDALDYGIITDTRSIDNSNNVDAALTYTHLYAQPQHELSFQGQYSRNTQTSKFIDEFDRTITGATVPDNKNINDSYNEEITFQVDYQKPFGSLQMLELGAKQIMRKVSSDFATFQKVDGNYEETTDPTRSNALNYDQNVSATYASYTLSFPSGYSFKGGARYEYTTIKAYTLTEDDIDIPSYGVIVPSINASKKLKNGNTLKLSYNRRIQRPSIRFLNPNPQYQNSLNVTVGNPNLDPEYTNNYELGYSTFIKGTSLNFTAFVRNTNDAIQSVREIPDVARPDSILTTYKNIGSESAYGSSIFANINIGKLSLNMGGDVYYSVLDNNSSDPNFKASNEGFVVNGRIFGSYKLPKDWSIQGFGFGRARQVQLQGYQGSFRMYSVGFQKEFNEKRGSIGLAAENFVTPSIKIRSETTTPTISQKSVNTMNNLSFRINFSYRIGKMSMDQRAGRRRSINNDDLKESGDGGMDAAGVQGGQIQGGQRQGGFNGGGARPAGQAPATNQNMVKADTAAVVDPVGKWSYTIESPQGGGGMIIIKKEADALSGVISSNRFNKDLPLQNIVLAGNALTFDYTVSFGGNEMVISVKSTISGDNLNGTVAVGQFGTFPLNATRVKE
jgi:outer membrane receptor protein involved in Fe transport